MEYNFFQNKSFGLDISERVFRLVCLRKCRKKIILVNYNELQVPEGVLKDGKIVEVDKAVNLIKQLILQAKGGKVKQRFVTACLAEQKTFIKLITLAYPDGKNVLEEIVEEAKKHIPYPINEVYLDWQYVSRDKSKVLIGVCPKDIIDNYQQVLMKAGLAPSALEIEGTAIVRSLFPQNQKINEPVMILDMGASRTGLIIYLQDSIPFSLSLTFSSDDLTKVLKDKLKINVEEAEEVKVTCGFDKNLAKGYCFKILKSEGEKLAQKIREANYFYQEHYDSSQTIHKLYLTGNGSKVPGLVQFLNEAVKMEVSYANPLVNIFESKIKITDDVIQSYTTAIGSFKEYLSE